jgi:molecular chaperone GrpE
MTEDARQSEAPAGRRAAEAESGEETLDSSLEALRREAEENWNKYLRAVAELDNLRKRSAREVENAHKFGAERLAQAVLPVHDSLAAAVAADSLDLETLIEGQQATLRLLDQALQSVGIREIDPRGEPFDPAKHEAMSMLQSAEVEPGAVLEVLQKGYELNDRLLRAAKVIVARAPGGD